MDQSANHLLMRGSQPGPADRMRDLLARTVQDHVTDQRSHASALEEIRKHLEGLEWLVKEVREHELTDLAGQLTAQTEAMRRQLDDAKETAPAWAESMPGHLRNLSAQMKPVAELPALWADLGVVSENVDQVLPRLESLCTLIGQARDMLKLQEERLKSMQQHGERLQQSMEAATSRFGRLDKAITELSQRAAYLDKELSAIKGRIDQGLAAQTARFDQGLAALSEKLETKLTEGLAGASDEDRRAGGHDVRADRAGGPDRRPDRGGPQPAGAAGRAAGRHRRQGRHGRQQARGTRRQADRDRRQGRGAGQPDRPPRRPHRRHR